jgi:hypothetical protein
VAGGAMILNSLFLAVWLARNVVSPGDVGPGEIVVGIVVPASSIAAIALARRPGTAFEVLAWIAAALNGATILLVLVPLVVMLATASGERSSAAELLATALLLLTLALNLAVLAPPLTGRPDRDG